MEKVIKELRSNQLIKVPIKKFENRHNYVVIPVDKIGVN